MLKVSVVVPVYNPGKYIQACIDSMLRQTLPAEQFEVIFVDDGSTDDSPGLLDALAAEHGNIQVIHQENSGWPGSPRNRGIDAAQGEYVFFCDNDDWLGDEALARMYDFAILNDADVVIGKMAGIGRGVPQRLFERTRTHASLANAPIMDSLTPHKLFRRTFLTHNKIRFPEGKRRLEDHLFVVTAYLLASNVGVYSDYTCYYHIRREDSANAGFGRTNWDSYFANLREALDVVVEHTSAGDLRNSIYRRWLRVEMVSRLTGNRFLALSESERQELVDAAHLTARQYFDQGVVNGLNMSSQAVARALMVGDLNVLVALAEVDADWKVRSTLDQRAFRNGILTIGGRVVLADWSSSAADTSDEALRRRVGAVDAATLNMALQKASMALYISQRNSKERWRIPVQSQSERLSWAFTANIDLDRVAAGRPLPPGRWDFYAEATALGINQTKRLEIAADSEIDESPQEGVRLCGGHPVSSYFTQGSRGFTITVGKEFPPPKPTANLTPQSIVATDRRSRSVLDRLKPWHSLPLRARKKARRWLGSR